MRIKLVLNFYFFLYFREKKSQIKTNVREHFVMTDKEGTVFHFIVEGAGISDVTKIPPEVGNDNMADFILYCFKLDK